MKQSRENNKKSKIKLYFVKQKEKNIIFDVFFFIEIYVLCVYERHSMLQSLIYLLSPFFHGMQNMKNRNLSLPDIKLQRFSVYIMQQAFFYIFLFLSNNNKLSVSCWLVLDFFFSEINVCLCKFIKKFSPTFFIVFFICASYVPIQHTKNFFIIQNLYMKKKRSFHHGKASS